MRDAVLTARTRHDPGHAVRAEDYLDQPAGLFVYRQRRGEDVHRGVVADVAAAAFVDGRVRGHEAVQPDRVEALVEHFTTAAVRSDMVALLHEPSEHVDRVLAETVAGSPVTAFTGPDGWEQTVWRVPDEVTGPLAEALGRLVHYIADGHHRVAAGLRLWERDGKPAQSALMCVLHPLGGLRLAAFHRRVAGPVDPAELTRLLGAAYEVRAPARPDVGTEDIRVYVDRRWLLATPRAQRPAGAAGLAAAGLHRHVLAPLLGPHAAERVESTPASTPLDELTEKCDRDGGALFALPPPGLDQLMGVADRGEVMPAKTTYFEPKPHAGVFLR